MQRSRLKLLPRWALWLALGGLLAAQQCVLLHPLAHLPGAPAAHAQAGPDPQAPDAADAACTLCLACAAVAQLAAGVPVAAPPCRAAALPAAAPVATGRPIQHAFARHNRGPPGGA